MERRVRPLVWSKKREGKLPNGLTAGTQAKWYEKWKIRTVHPNLRIDYFQKVDTKEKAYWLGFLYADGSLTRSTRGTVYITIELNTKDEERINHFCKALCLDKNKVLSNEAWNRIRHNQVRLQSNEQ